MEPVITINPGTFHRHVVCFVVRKWIDTCRSGADVNVCNSVDDESCFGWSEMCLKCKTRCVLCSGASKWDIRQRVWDYIEEKNLANFPRPVHNRIPNFKACGALFLPRATWHQTVNSDARSRLTSSPWMCPSCRPEAHGRIAPCAVCTETTCSLQTTSSHVTNTSSRQRDRH